MASDLYRISGDIEEWFDNSFNKLINRVVDTLSTQEVSPVYTGYFASSWTARSRQVQAESRKDSDSNRRNKAPWGGEAGGNSPYHVKTQGKGGAMTAWGVKKNRGEIQRRYPGPFYFNYKKSSPVFIGNTTFYRAYALEDGNVLAYVQDLAQEVQNAFREKPRLATLRVGAEPMARVGGAIPTYKTGSTPRLKPAITLLEP